jgi:hypothetical protein
MAEDHHAAQEDGDTDEHLQEEFQHGSSAGWKQLQRCAEASLGTAEALGRSRNAP